LGRAAWGLYFLSSGAGVRASQIVYDREGSSFALAQEIDWGRALAGVDLLHMSGITPALGPASAALARSAADAAGRLGIAVSFDGNYRAQLWQRWEPDPGPRLQPLVANAEILFGNHRDISLLLGRSFLGDGEERRREAALAAFERIPQAAVHRLHRAAGDECGRESYRSAHRRPRACGANR
jgi:2-dehydro-3-deoxygluconokinase